MQASTLFGQTATGFVNAMSVGEVLALPIHSTVKSLIRASAMVTVCSWNGQIGRVSRPALQDLRSVSEAHCRMNLHGAPVINTLRSTLDMFLDVCALSEPYGPPSDDLVEMAEANMDVAMHLMAIVHTPEQRSNVYSEAVHTTLASNATQLLEMTYEMYENAPPVVWGREGIEAERVLMQGKYAETRVRVLAALDALHGMQLTRYRFKKILNDMVSNVLLVLVRGLIHRLATAYHQAIVSMTDVYELTNELASQHTSLLGLVLTRLQQQCSDANVYIKHNPATIVDDASFNGVQLDAHMLEAHTAVTEVHNVFLGELQVAYEAGPIVHAMAAADAALAHMHHLGGAQPDPANVQALVDGVMARATVVQLMEEEDCAACMMPSSEMVLCHGCQRCHCCVGCTRHIVQTNLFAHRCPVCRSPAFPAPTHQ